MKKGFTLIELIIVITLMGIMLTLVSPLLLNSFSNLEVKTSVRKALALMRYARFQAINKGEETSVAVDRAKGILKFNGKEVKVPKDVELTFNDVTGEENYTETAGITFYPVGGSSGGNVVLSKGESVWQVKVDLIGYAKIVE